ERNGTPTILYLGSSKAALNEPAVFTRWLEAIRSADDVLRDANVILRPHPSGEGGDWEAWQPPADPRLTIDTPRKNEPLTLARALGQSDAVVALSTTAEIEAAIMGRPVVTFRAGSDAPAQEGKWHFHVLLEEHGGFVIDTPDLDEHVARLADVLRGGY